MFQSISTILYSYLSLILTGTVYANAESISSPKPPNECILNVRNCRNYPQLSQSTFRDTFGETYLDAARSPGSCFRRAENLHHWCGNGRHNLDSDSDLSVRVPQISSLHLPSQTIQDYHPDVCEDDINDLKGWSYYKGHCYLHIWLQKSWNEAENYCNKVLKSNLCSIHSKDENEFVFTLTHGLSAWIGYHDSYYEKKSWTDDTQVNYENMASKNDTISTVTDKAQQWYNFEEPNRSTFVCKKKAKENVNLKVYGMGNIVTDFDHSYLVKKKPMEDNELVITSDTHPDSITEEEELELEMRKSADEKVKKINEKLERRSNEENVNAEKSNLKGMGGCVSC